MSFEGYVKWKQIHSKSIVSTDEQHSFCGSGKGFCGRNLRHKCHWVVTSKTAMSPVLNTWWRETCRFFANCWCWCRVDGCRIVAPIVWTFLVKMVYAMFDVDLTWLDVDCNYFHVLFFSVYKNIPNFCTFFACALRVRFQNNKHVKLRNVVDIYYRPIYRECVENRLAQVFQRNLTTASFLTQCTLYIICFAAGSNKPRIQIVCLSYHNPISHKTWMSRRRRYGIIMQ